MARIRKTNKLKQPGQDRWLVSYADYMTLMFALFVVLYSSAMLKEESFDVLSQSLGKIFEVSGNEGTGIAGEGILTNQVSELEHFDGNNLLEEKGPELNKQNIQLNESNQKQLGNPLEQLNKDLQTALYELTENGLAKLELADDWLTIELNSGLLFPSGSATASSTAKIVVSEVAKVLSSVNNLIEVRGYTDSQPINNEIFSSNWQLSAARAASVTNLLESSGLTQQRLAIKANGANNPVASNLTDSGRAQNRRVVIALSKFSYQADEKINPEKTVLQKQLSDNISQSLPDFENLTVIKLPNGGIRITTRRDQTDKDGNNKN